MIADCAIDPEVFAQWRYFQSLHEDFGVSRGRLISKYPKKSWYRTVALTAEEVNTPMKFKQIEERLISERFKRKTKPPGGRKHDPELSWKENAINANPPFDLIICSDSSGEKSAVAVDELMKDEPPFFRSGQSYINRDKKSLIGAASMLLACSDRVVIVDPNFRADEPRFYKPMIYLLDQFEAQGRWPKRLEVHTKQTRSPKDLFRRGPQSSQWLQHIVPSIKDCTLTVCYWDELPTGGKPHARFILTDIGGIYFDHGLDTGEGKTLVTLLEDEIWKDIYLTFDYENLPQDLDSDEFVLHFENK